MIKPEVSNPVGGDLNGQVNANRETLQNELFYPEHRISANSNMQSFMNKYVPYFFTFFVSFFLKMCFIFSCVQFKG